MVEYTLSLMVLDNAAGCRQLATVSCKRRFSRLADWLPWLCGDVQALQAVRPLLLGHLMDDLMRFIFIIHLANGI
jgi:hypothetical protein